MKKIIATIAFAFAAFVGVNAIGTTDAAACTTACGMKYKAECTNGVKVYSNTSDVASLCTGGKSYTAQPPRYAKPTPTRPAVVAQATQAPVRGKVIRPKPPVCRENQPDFTRWSDPTLERHGLTIICDKNYGGLNLKPANSGEPTRVDGFIVRFNKAPSFGPQVMSSGYYEENGDLYIITTRGTYRYSVWGTKKVN